MKLREYQSKTEIMKAGNLLRVRGKYAGDWCALVLEEEHGKLHTSWILIDEAQWMLRYTNKGWYMQALRNGHINHVELLSVELVASAQNLHSEGNPEGA